MTFSGHNPRKRFGQHWLKDQAVLNQIVSAAELGTYDRVLEIGPGRGALTEKLLLSKASFIHAIELDQDLVDGLRKRFEKYERFNLEVGDVLNQSLLPPNGISLNKVVANIPYNITSPLLKRLLGELGCLPERRYERLVLLLQKEVAERILAKAGESNFSAMSVRVQLIARSIEVCDVPPKCFKPVPKVHSKVIVIEPFAASERLDMDTEKFVGTLLKIAFISRRKKLSNTLVNVVAIEDLKVVAEEIGIDLGKRPQELSPQCWVALARGIKNRDKLVRKI